MVLDLILMSETGDHICVLRQLSKRIYIILPPANEIWGKVIFSVGCVKNSVHKGDSTWAGTSP